MLNTLSQTITLNKNPFALECGASLSSIEIAFNTYGALNSDRSNAIVVLHALTGAPAAHEWWSGLIGDGKLLDTSRYFIVAPNLLGSCYGTTGPESMDITTEKSYLASFPEITPRDIARVNLALLNELSIESVHLAIGGSLGGMVVLEMAAIAPQRFRAIAPIAVSSEHSAWRLAFSSFVRKTIISHDPTLQDRAKLQAGMHLARQAAMISYRSSDEFNSRFGRESSGDKFEVENYLEHQGQKLVDRFSPYSYLTLTRAMELYDLSDRRNSIEDVAASVDIPSLFVGISSDILYGVDEIERFAAFFPRGQYQTLNAIHGHDSFLVDQYDLEKIVAAFLTEIEIEEIEEAFAS